MSLQRIVQFGVTWPMHYKYHFCSSKYVPSLHHKLFVGYQNEMDGFIVSSLVDCTRSSRAVSLSTDMVSGVCIEKSRPLHG
jgi:hypothetical protein